MDTSTVNEDVMEDKTCSSVQNYSKSLTITDLPLEVVQHIMKNLSFQNIAKLRLVSQFFNNVCSSLLNSEFNQLRILFVQRFNNVKAMMPRRESARRKHPLSRQCDIFETLYMRLSLLHMTFGKHIENKSCCFFPGEIIDECYKILHYIDSTPNLNRAYKVTDELFDLSTMALEYFKERIEPHLPEVYFLSYEMLQNPPVQSVDSVDLFQSTRASLLNVDISEPSVSKEISKSNLSLQDSFKDDLKKIMQQAKRNRNDILKIRQSLKISKMRIKNAVRKVEQLSWQQKSCKGLLLNDLYNIEAKNRESTSSDTFTQTSTSFPDT